MDWSIWALYASPLDVVWGVVRDHWPRLVCIAACVDFIRVSAPGLPVHWLSDACGEDDMLLKSREGVLAVVRWGIAGRSEDPAIEVFLLWGNCCLVVEIMMSIALWEFVVGVVWLPLVVVVVGDNELSLEEKVVVCLEGIVVVKLVILEETDFVEVCLNVVETVVVAWSEEVGFVSIFSSATLGRPMNGVSGRNLSSSLITTGSCFVSLRGSRDCRKLSGLPVDFSLLESATLSAIFWGDTSIIGRLVTLSSVLRVVLETLGIWKKKTSRWFTN